MINVYVYMQHADILPNIRTISNPISGIGPHPKSIDTVNTRAHFSPETWMDGAAVSAALIFDITKCPMRVEEGNVAHLTRPVRCMIAENVPAADRLPPTMGVDMTNFDRLAAPETRYNLPPYTMMQVVRVHPLTAPAGAILVHALPKCKLRLPIKPICIHSPRGNDVSVTTSELANQPVCKICASERAFTNWGNGLLDANACIGKRINNILLTEHMLSSWALGWHPANGYGVFRVGAVMRMFGVAGLFDIASNGYLAPTKVPAPTFVAQHVMTMFPSDTDRLAHLTGKTNLVATALLLKIFGRAAETARTLLDSPAEVVIAEEVLRAPGIFHMAHDKSHIFQPSWGEIETWHSLGLDTSDNGEFAIVELNTHTVIADVIRDVRNLCTTRTLKVTISSPDVPMADIAAIVREHPKTQIVMACWHVVSYILF